MGSSRTAEVSRETRETQIALKLALDGSGRYEITTGVGFLDHMLEQLAKHGRFDLTVKATGDIARDPHHLVEDVGTALGRAFDDALGERRGIVRFGHAIVPMDEALVLIALDLSGRGHAAINLTFERDKLGELPCEDLVHMLESFAHAARMNLHVSLLSGANDHHRAEATFKGLARALSDAVRVDARLAGEVPSTKDVL